MPLWLNDIQISFLVLFFVLGYKYPSFILILRKFTPELMGFSITFKSYLRWWIVIATYLIEIYTVTCFCELMNKLIEIFQWIMVSMIPFVANADLVVNLQWIVLYWSGKSITNNKKCKEYNYNSATIKFQCTFA